jgi:hypothetical protein
MTSAEAIAIEIDDGARVEWELDALRMLVAGESAEPAWRLRGGLDWDAVDSLRLVTAAFENGRLLALAAVRPAGADGHDEPPRGALVQPTGDVVAFAEALLSTEYDADGSPSRIGLELYPEAEAVPLRAAADRSSPTRTHDGIEVTVMSFRLEGVGGSGVFERVTRA